MVRQQGVKLGHPTGRLGWSCQCTASPRPLADFAPVLALNRVSMDRNAQGHEAERGVEIERTQY